MHLALIDEIRIIWMPLQLGSRGGGASGGALPSGPPQEALPLNPTGALKQAAGPYTARLTRVASFDFLHFALALLKGIFSDFNKIIL